MSAPDFDQMSKEQILAWFASAPESELAEVLREAQPGPEIRRPEPSAAGTSIPLLLTSIRLPVELVRDLDEIAATEGINRSEAIRIAVAAHVQQRRGGVEPTAAEHALDVLRRVVGEHAKVYREAA